jgi:tRNA 2-selenouridine synthase
MTSGQKSSKSARSAPPSAVESLAGAYHPHAIEVQEFSHYARVVDVRPLSAFEEDHIPGAVQFTPLALPATGLQEEGLTEQLPSALEALVSEVKPDQAILLYCGRGGLDSLPLGKMLRWRGWTVDVLPGGWINYRRWVEAGLEVLPRLVSFRVIASPLGCETARVLRALLNLGQQVLDVEAMAGWRHGSLSSHDSGQPSQAGFESLLVNALRSLDPRKPVWVGDVAQKLGPLVVPRSLLDALVSAPAVSLEVQLPERVRCWKEDEGLLSKKPFELMEALERLTPPPSEGLLAKWRTGTDAGLLDVVLESVVKDYLVAPVRSEYGARTAGPNGVTQIAMASLGPVEIKQTLRNCLVQMETFAKQRP